MAKRHLDEPKMPVANSPSIDFVSAEHVVAASRPRTSAAATVPRPGFDRLILSGLPKRFGPAQTENQRQTRGSVTACRERGGAVEPILRAHFQGIEESVLPWRQGRADAESRLGRRDQTSTQ
jgi:hypothetical protein